MKITWKRVSSYEEAKDFFEIIYLHEWDGHPFYWGIVDRAKFGGTKRNSNDRNGRYNPGYRHWIEGCLQHGGRLYIGTLEEKGKISLHQIEQYLIAQYPSKMNKRTGTGSNIERICHDGDIPLSILRGGKFPEQDSSE